MGARMEKVRLQGRPELEPLEPRLLLSGVNHAPVAGMIEGIQWAVSEGGNGHWYQVAQTPGPVNWEVADQAARQAGGYLATITSAAENAFVASLVANPAYWVEVGNSFGPWLGGYQPPGSPEPNGDWRWVTGEPWGYTNWAPGEPNNSDEEDYLQFGGTAGPGSKWNDARNNSAWTSHAYVMETSTPVGTMAVSTKEDTPLVGTLLAMDPDGDPLTFALVDGPATGDVAVDEDGSFTYTPALHFVGSDSFTYKANDGQAESNIATVLLTVDPVNDAPVAVDDAATAEEDTAVSGNVLANDTDVDGGPAGAGHVFTDAFTTGAQSPSWTVAQSRPGFYAYDGSQGDVRFTKVGSNPTSIQAIWAELNLGALSPTGRLSGDFDTQVDFRDAVLPGTGADQVEFDAKFADGYFFFVVRQHGDGRNDVHVWEGVGGTQARGQINTTATSGTLRITRVGHVMTAYFNGAVVWSNPNATTADLVFLHCQLQNNLSSNDNTAVTYHNFRMENAAIQGSALTAALAQAPSHGSVVLDEDGAFTYTPNAGFSGTDVFTYRAYDGADYSNVANVTITVNRVNDAPVVADHAVSTDEDTPLVGTVSGTDVDGDTLTFALLDGPVYGSVVLTAEGSFTYTPAADFNGTDAFTYKANDGQADSNVGTVTIAVNAVNDAPVAHGRTVTVTEDGQIAIRLSASDMETAEVSLTFTTASLPGTGVLKDGQGNLVILGQTFTGPPTLIYESGIECDGAGTTGFTFTVTDRGDPDRAGAMGLTSDPATVTVNIVPAVGTGGGSVDAGGVVRIGGTTGNDVILVTHTCDRRYLKVIVNGVVVTSDIPLAGVSEIRAWGREGNDWIEVIDLGTPSMLHGGAGNDMLIGGAGNDLIFGGSGNDLLSGGRGNDFLVGGNGRDSLLGDGGHDILVSGGVGNRYSISDLRGISAAWAASQGGEDGGEDSAFDVSQVKDTDFDVLWGGTGHDRFIVGQGDWIVDLWRARRDQDTVTVV